MDKPCVIVELDPTDLRRGRTILTAALSLFHLDVDVVLTLTGVEEPTPAHGDAVAALCSEIANGAPLPDVVLEGVNESAQRHVLLRVRADDEISAVVEAIVLLTSIAMRSWETADQDAPTVSDPVAAWLADRDALVNQRDEMANVTAPVQVVAVVATATGLMDASQVLMALRDRGCQVDLVVVPSGDSRGTGELTERTHSLGCRVRDMMWLARHLQAPTGPPMIAVYLDTPTVTWPDEAQPDRVAEYGVRVAYLAGAAERLDADATADSYDAPVLRIAWRTYVPTARHEALLGEHNRVGKDAVRVVGSLRTARVLAKTHEAPPAQWVATAAGRPVVLWCPTVSFRGGDSALRHYLDALLAVAAEGDVMVMIRLDPSQEQRARSLHDGADLMERVRRAQEAGQVLYDPDPDAAVALRFADALICGVDGPIATFVATDRPVLYTYRQGVAPVLRRAEYVLALDIADDEAGITRFCTAVAAGHDDRAEARRLAKAAYFSLDDALVAERIVDDMVYSLSHEMGDVDFTGEPALLSVAMIVKNEERNLPRALESIERLGDLVHEVCIYDTGSQDGTIAIALSHGAVVQEGYWDADFARARNAAIDMCSSRWVLIMDADEAVTADVDSLRRTLRQALMVPGSGVDVLDVTVRDLDTAGSVKSEWGSHRLLRPDRTRYRGEVHEDVFRADGALVSAVLIDSAAVCLEHNGYNDMAVLTDKLVRNADIAHMEVAAREQTGDVEALIRALVDRARSRVAVGGVDEAVADYEQVRRLSTTRTYRWWGMEQYVSVLMQVGRLDEAQSVVDELLAEEANPAFSRWLQARILSARGRHEEAYAMLSKVNQLTDSLGMVVPQTSLLDPKLELAVRTGRLDEALAHLIELMVTWGQVAERGPLFVRLWGRRPASALVDLIHSGDPDNLRRIVAELNGAGGRGPELAAVVGSVIDMPMQAHR